MKAILKIAQFLMFLVGFKMKEKPTIQELAFAIPMTSLAVVAVCVPLMILALCQSMVVSTGIYSQSVPSATFMLSATEPVVTPRPIVVSGEETHIIPALFTVKASVFSDKKERYDVRPGDTMIVIAEHFAHLCTNYRTIARENHVTDPDKIQAGAVLYIQDRCESNKTSPILNEKQSAFPGKFASRGASQEKHFPRAIAHTDNPAFSSSEAMVDRFDHGTESGEDRSGLVAVSHKF